MKVYADDYGRIDVDSTAKTVRYERSDVPFSTPEQAEKAYGEVSRALDGVDRPRFSLLVDLRRAPGSNDPRFEQAMARARKRMFERFRRAGVLVRTAAGALQVQRHAREDALGVRVFHEESAALVFVRDDA